MNFYGQKYIDAVERTDEWLYRQIFSGWRDGYFMECGALNGMTISNCRFLEEFMGWRGINIEPSSAFDELIINRMNSINLKVALSDVDAQKIEFFEDVTNFAQSSSDVNRIPQAHERRASMVPTITYKTLVDRIGIRKVDFFSLDVEGMEMRVLDGMKGAKCMPLDIFVETLHSNKSDLFRMLDNLGYDLVEEFHIDALCRFRA